MKVKASSANGMQALLTVLAGFVFTKIWQILEIILNCWNVSLGTDNYYVESICKIKALSRAHTRATTEQEAGSNLSNL